MTGEASAREHWDQAHAGQPPTETGWYEAMPEVSLDLLDRAGVSLDERILDVGCGASTFVDHLLERGYREIVACDISAVAVALLRERLGPRAEQVRFVVDDLTNPGELLKIGEVGVWHDRAVLHFLTGERERNAYAATLRQLVRPGGFAIMATFALDGADHCSGLPVRRYDAGMLAEVVGPGFELVESRRHVYRQASGGLRPYVYALFRRDGPPRA